MARMRWAVRCRAHSKRTGRPCGQWAIRGGYVCRHHGGRTPNARNAARRRLAQLALERKQGSPLRLAQLARLGGREEQRDFRRYVRGLVDLVRAETELEQAESGR